nr:PREDICTED: phosphatidylinositide phosphatase SAC2-like isoform X2 [Latimeria chalumnae]|eukprot:XP_014346507.1 PREDICTED: phosphatidylinositide phosphatase SAC2-like isoform X2 [Latimeria chalumnae]
MFELLQSRHNYIISGGESALCWSRLDGTVQIATDVEASDVVCLGLVEGIIGRMQLHVDSEWYLVLIRQKTLVGQIPPGHSVYKVTKVAVIPLSRSEPADLDLEVCRTHQSFKNIMKTASIKRSTKHAEIKRKTKQDKVDARLVEELVRMLTESEPIYYSLTYDITNSVQRQQESQNKDLPLWKKVDDRFFWNKYMMQDLINLKDPRADGWIIPIILGFVQIEEIKFNPVGYLESNSNNLEKFTKDQQCSKFLIALISRRSRHRAGMRYKRRGVDKNGNVANYVETEQIVYSNNNTLSFVLVRGSIPVFWSQCGYHYSPKPQLDHTEEETTKAFRAHFEEQLRIYSNQVIINLMDAGGTEKVIGDAYLRQVLLYNSPDLLYVAFDFHAYCHGMKFGNVQILLDGIEGIIKGLKWCWVIQNNMKYKQIGTVRVNCLDCLDRTNVVQAAIARAVLEEQLRALGVLPPKTTLPLSSQRVYQLMWANNGDAISRQYTGTVALKGDFTRTGERKLAGLVKDGYTSASRYYLNHFRDTYRQTMIDMLQGIMVKSSLQNVYSREQLHNILAMKEAQRSLKTKFSTLQQYYNKLLIPADETFQGGWLLTDCDPSYNKDLERVTEYQRIVMEDLEKIELGPEPTSENSQISCMRLYYLNRGNTGYFYTIKAAYQDKPEDEKETLQGIAEMLCKMKKQTTGADLPIYTKQLEMKETKHHENVYNVTHLPREKSETIHRYVVEKLLSFKTTSKHNNKPLKYNSTCATNMLSKDDEIIEEEESTTESFDSLDDNNEDLPIHVKSDDELNLSDSEGSSKECTDQVLESCGILATSHLDSVYNNTLQKSKVSMVLKGNAPYCEEPQDKIKGEVFTKLSKYQIDDINPHNYSVQYDETVKKCTITTVSLKASNTKFSHSMATPIKKEGKNSMLMSSFLKIPVSPGRSDTYDSQLPATSTENSTSSFNNTEAMLPPSSIDQSELLNNTSNCPKKCESGGKSNKNKVMKMDKACQTEITHIW